MIVIAINGVLRDPSTKEVIPSGRVLYRAFTEMHGVALLSDGESTAETNWLAAHGFRDHQFLAEGTDRAAQMSRVRMRGSIDFVIEAGPEGAAEVLAAGSPALFFALPAYSTPSHMPGAALVPTRWDALVDEVARQKAIREGDRRLDGQELL